MLTCAHCEYKTDRRYNLVRHQHLKHIDKVKEEYALFKKLYYDGELIYNTLLNTSNIGNLFGSENVNIESENVNIESENVNNLFDKLNINSENVNNINTEHIVTKYYENGNINNNIIKCDTCYKMFSNQYNLKVHKDVCKKITDPFECSICHAVYSSRQSLSIHKKKCKSTALIVKEEVKDNTTNTVLTPITNISHSKIDTLQHYSNSHNTYNINIFPKDVRSPFTLYTDHIDPMKLKRETEAQGLPDAAAFSIRWLLENRANLPVHKKNMRSRYSYVHIGNDKWAMRDDKEVYALLSYHISKCFRLFLNKNDVPRLERYYKYLLTVFENIIFECDNESTKDMVKRAKKLISVIMIQAYEFYTDEKKTKEDV